MKYFLLLALTFFIIACDKKDQANGISPMHWDRDMCARCVMVISDRKNSVQVKVDNNTYKFDDLGCMVIWADETKKDILNNSKIYVTDVLDGSWIDAKKAFYTSGNSTPMGYGYSAYKSKQDISSDKEILSFTEVYNKIKSK